MKKLALLLATVFLTSCTYSISMAHTEGQASDVIDETNANTPTVSPQVTIPFTKGLV